MRGLKKGQRFVKESLRGRRDAFSRRRNFRIQETKVAVDADSSSGSGFLVIGRGGIGTYGAKEDSHEAAAGGGFARDRGDAIGPM